MVWKVSHCFCINPLCNIWKRDRESTQRCWADFYACRSPMQPGLSRSTVRRGMACARSVGPGLPPKSSVVSVDWVEGSQRGWKGSGDFASLRLVLGQLFSCSLIVTFLPHLFPLGTWSGRSGRFQAWDGWYLWGRCSSGFGHRAGQSSHRDQQSSRVPAPQIPACCIHQRAKPLSFWSHPAKYSLGFGCFFKCACWSDSENIRSVRNR